MGIARGEVDFGGGSLVSMDPLNDAAVIAKFDNNGSHIWSKMFDGVTQDEIWDASIDSEDNTVFIGWSQIGSSGGVEGGLNFGGGKLSPDRFLVKFNPDGDHVWSKTVGQSTIDLQHHVEIGPSDEVVIAGDLVGTVDLGGGPLTQDGRGQPDILLAKFDCDGQHVWSQDYGDDGRDTPWNLAVSAMGDVFVTGAFTNALDFGNGAFQSAGGRDVFVALFDQTGRLTWSASYGDEREQNGAGVGFDDVGNLYLGGRFASCIDFGLGEMCSASNTDERTFLVKYEFPALPVALQSFDTDASPSQVELHWMLFEEEPDATFEVSRSVADGNQFAHLKLAIARNNITYSAIDRDVTPGESYRYRVGVTDDEGTRILFETAAVEVPPSTSALVSVYPNPFNPSTKITYSLQAPGLVLMTIHTSDGSLVKRLVNEIRPVGERSIEWNGRDDKGVLVSSGIYFLRLRANKHLSTRKLTVLK